MRRGFGTAPGPGPSARQATRPVCASSATSFPSDQRLTTVVPSASTPTSFAGHRRYDQNGVTRCFPETGWSAYTWRAPA
ncbi:hypothetical protein B0E53_04902 [Micromonospora sp. MH33]|nr:hypothetical protein B0E53_04902 [Micromonospora sp. MH33]